jgi:hypothetical protein
MTSPWCGEQGLGRASLWPGDDVKSVGLRRLQWAMEKRLKRKLKKNTPADYLKIYCLSLQVDHQ